MAKVCVVLAVAEPLLRLGMRTACQDGGMAVVAEADGAAGLRSGLEGVRRPAVIVSESHALEPDPPTTVAELAATHRVLVVDPPGPVDRPRLLRAGASGFLRRGSDGALLCRAVASAHHGELVLDGAAPPAGPSREAALIHLTRRELDVLRLIAAGRSSQQAAGALHMSMTTLKTHLRNASAKLGASTRAAAAARATALGLLE